MGSKHQFKEIEFLTYRSKKNFILEKKEIKNALKFKNLGSEIQEEGETEKKINRRLETTKRAISSTKFYVVKQRHFN